MRLVIVSMILVLSLNLQGNAQTVVTLTDDLKTNSTAAPCIMEASKANPKQALWVQIVGWSATSLGLLSSLPAIYHVFKAKDVGGLSPVAFGVGSMTMILGATYNIALKNPILIAGSGWGLVCNALMFYAMFKYRKSANDLLQHSTLQDQP